MVGKERMQALTSQELLALNFGLMNVMGDNYQDMVKRLQHYQAFDTPIDLGEYLKLGESLIGALQSAVDAMRVLEARVSAEQPPRPKKQEG